MSSMDSRIPVLFARPGGTLPPETGVLASGHDPVAGAVAVARVVAGAPGVIACACCAPRSDVAKTLGRLFLARARGEVPFFRQLMVTDPALEPAVRAAMADDVIVSARFRLDQPPE